MIGKQLSQRAGQREASRERSVPHSDFKISFSIIFRTINNREGASAMLACCLPNRHLRLVSVGKVRFGTQ